MPLDEDSYHQWARYSRKINFVDFTLDDILTIINSGDIDSLRELSRYFYRTNSAYRNNIDFLANLFLYDYVIVPIFEEGKGSENLIKKAFYNACKFVDALSVPNVFAHIIKTWLIDGIYNGILRINDDGIPSIQDLPLSYCRSRFKDFNNLNILEFNISYFSQFSDNETREEALRTFPPSIIEAWRKKEKGLLISDWVPILPNEGGISFFFPNNIFPALISSIPELKKLDDATKREEKRENNELYKLLIQKMPTDKNGELVFELEEVADIHASIANMLKSVDTVDVLTTFGDTSLESLQDSTAASQAADRLAKYRTNAWNALGRGEILFNATNSSSLAYSIKKDETIMKEYLNILESWLKHVVNQYFSKNTLEFDIELLPTTRFNLSEYQQSYFRGAQYGYSKMFAGVAMGIKQTSQLSLMNFENDFLGMTEKMVPLQSSYTSSGNATKNSGSEEKVQVSSTVKDITNTGGRPELPDELKSEKTQANIDSAG